MLSFLIGLAFFFKRGENFEFVSTWSDSVRSLFLTVLSELPFELVVLGSEISLSDEALGSFVNPAYFQFSLMEFVVLLFSIWGKRSKFLLLAV